MLVFGAHYSVVLLKRGAIIPCFCQKMDVIIPLFVKKGRQFFVVFVNRTISRLKRLILAVIMD